MGKALDIFVERLAAAIDNKSIRKGEICEAAKIGRPQLDRYLKKENQPNLDAAERIASALGMSLGAMLNEKSSPPRPHTKVDCIVTALGALRDLKDDDALRDVLGEFLKKF